MSENNNIRFKMLNEYKESRRNSKRLAQILKEIPLLISLN